MRKTLEAPSSNEVPTDYHPLNGEVTLDEAHPDVENFHLPPLVPQEGRHAISADLDRRVYQVTPREVGAEVVEQPAPQHELDIYDPMSRRVDATIRHVENVHDIEKLDPKYLITHNFADEEAGYGQVPYHTEHLHPKGLQKIRKKLARLALRFRK